MPEIHSSWKINDHQAGISRCNFTFLDHVLQILKTPLATLNSIIENSILFPYFYWILVAYWENLRFYGRHKKLSIAVAQKLSCKKCTLVKVWRVPGQKTTFFGNICNCFKIQLTKNTAARLQNAVDMRPGQLSGTRIWLVRMCSEYHLVAVMTSVQYDGEGSNVLRGHPNSSDFCMTPTPDLSWYCPLLWLGIMLQCHNYNLLNTDWSKLSSIIFLIS